MAQQLYRTPFKKALLQFITEPDPFLAMLKWVMTEMMRTEAEANWYQSWKAINNLDKNADAFLQAVEMTGVRMKKLVARIQEIEAKTECK